MTPPALTFRRARAKDAQAVAPLAYDSGPKAFDYVFTHRTRMTALDFLANSLTHRDGEFGYHLHFVAEEAGHIVAAGSCYNGRDARAFMLPAARAIFRCYGPLQGLAVIRRGLAIEKVVALPVGEVHLLSHIAVVPGLRGRGIGEAMVQYLLQRGRDAGSPVAALDVAFDNPRAQALYTRLGFRVVHEVESSLRNATAAVPGVRRMELALG